MKSSSSYPKTFTLLAVASAVAMTLSACGGGSTNEAGGTASGLLSNTVTAGAKTVSAGQATAISAYAIIRGAAPSSMAWTIAPLGTVNSGDPVPVISDASCTTATLTPPVVTGTSGEGSCNTSIYFPPNSKAGTWRVKNTAASTTAGSVSNYIDITVAPAALGGFRLVESPAAMSGMIGRPVSMSVPFTIDPGASASNIKYSWVAEAGNPAVVPIAGASTSSASFTPTAAGQYAFKVTATADVNGFTQTSTANVVAVVQAVSSDELNLGGVSQVAANESVFLTGSVVKADTSATYSYKWEQVSGVEGGPERVILSGANSATASFVAPRTAGNYTFKFIVVKTNANGSQQISSDQKTVVVRKTVAALFNASAGDIQTLDIGNIAQLKGSITSQAAGSDVTYSYQWRQVGASPIAVTIANANSPVASVNPNVAGTYTFELTVTAITPTGTSSVTSQTQVVVRSVSTPNTTFALSANAGSAKITTPNTVTSLQGTYTAQGTATGVLYSYQWTQLPTGAPNVAISSPTSLTPSFIPTTAGEYGFRLTVTATLPGGATQTATSDTRVLVGQTGGTFTLSAGNAQSVDANTVTTLVGAVTPQGDLSGASFAYSWAQIGASPAPVTISNANALTASFVPTTPGTYTFELTTTATVGGQNITRTAQTQIVVKSANSVPVTPFAMSANAGTAQIATPNTVTSLAGAYTTQGDSAGVTYSLMWSQIPNGSPAVTLSNPTSATPSFIPTVTGEYAFRLVVTARMADGSTRTATSDTQVLVGQTGGTFSLSAGNAQTVDVGTAAMLASSATPQGNFTGATYSASWVQVGATPAPVTISNATSATASFIPTVVGTYTFEVTVTATLGGQTIVRTSQTQVLAKAVAP